MASHIYVNNKTYSVSVSLPNGGRFDLKPGHAICGHFFQRLAVNQILIPMEGVPKRHQKSVTIHDPLNIREGRPFPEEEAATSTPEVAPTQVSEPANAPEEPEAVVVEEVAVEAPPIEEFEGKTQAEWRTWLVSSQDSTIGQKFSVDGLKQFAEFMGVANTDATKAQIIQQLKEMLSEDDLGQ